jgi:hypothetical protein
VLVWPPQPVPAIDPEQPTVNASGAQSPCLVDGHYLLKHLGDGTERHIRVPGQTSGTSAIRPLLCAVKFIREPLGRIFHRIRIQALTKCLTQQEPDA